MAGKDEDRARRLAAALRENLRRRKAQARASTEQEGSRGAPPNMAAREGEGDRERDDHP